MKNQYEVKVQTLKNRSNMDEKASSESTHAFCSLFDRFGLDFDLQFGAVWPPRAFKKRVQNQSSKTGRPLTENFFLAGASRSPPYRLQPLAASRHRKATMGTHVQGKCPTKTSTEQELQNKNEKRGRGKQISKMH